MNRNTLITALLIVSTALCCSLAHSCANAHFDPDARAHTHSNPGNALGCFY